MKKPALLCSVLLLACSSSSPGVDGATTPDVAAADVLPADVVSDQLAPGDVAPPDATVDLAADGISPDTAADSGAPDSGTPDAGVDANGTPDAGVDANVDLAADSVAVSSTPGLARRATRHRPARAPTRRSPTAAGKRPGTRYWRATPPSCSSCSRPA